MFIRSCLFFTLIYLGKSDDCLPRDYGNGGTVCVCNSDYCDTVKPIQRPSAGEFIVYESSKKGLRMQYSKGLFKKEPITGANKLNVNKNEKHQIINGWGGALTDSTGINFNSLGNNTKEHFIRSYFSEDGIEYSTCRVPIAGTDFSTHPYAYNEFPGDVNLTKFNLTKEDYELKIPIIKEALRLRNGTFRLIGSAWSAPAWMKTNNNLYGFGFLQEQYYQIWANYHIKFLEAYKKEGINFWGLTTGNEPVNGIIPLRDLNSMGWTPFSQSKWISENLGPTLRGSEFSKIKLMVLDDQRFFLPWWVNILLNDNVTRNYVDGIAIHWYYDTITPALVLDATKSNFPDKFMLLTEACNGDRPWQTHVILGSWDRAENYIEDIMENLYHGVSGWIDWNLALDLQGGPTWIDNFVDAPILVNATSDEFYKQPMFYALGHFSKFIPVDSIRIGISPAKSKVSAVAAQRPDGGTVIVLYNKSKSQQVTVSLHDSQNGYINVKLDTNSIQTILYW